MKSRWAKYRADAFVALCAFFMLWTGVSGFLDAPSPALTSTIGAATSFYSLTLVLASLFAVLAVWKKWRSTELLCFAGMAALSVLHASLIFVSAEYAANQTGWRVMAGAFNLLALGIVRWDRGVPPAVIENHIERLDNIRTIAVEESDGY